MSKAKSFSVKRYQMLLKIEKCRKYIVLIKLGLKNIYLHYNII